MLSLLSTSRIAAFFAAFLGWRWPTVAVAQSIDKDWDVTFMNAVATFDDTSTTEPEVLITYNASAPNGNSKYYEQKVLLKDCLTYTTDGAVAPAVLLIPDSDYDSANRELTTWVDIDTGAIEGSSDFWSRTSAARGKVEFCVEMELHNEQNLGMAVEYTVVALDVDTAAGFEVTGVNYTNELQTSAEEDIEVDYPITAFFCDDTNAAVTPAPTLFPGDVLQVCVTTGDSADATVVDVKSVKVVNTAPEPDLSLEIINGDGDATNGQTLKACDAASGVCNFKTVTFSALYQLDTDYDGILEDVSASAGIEGIAVLNFGSPPPSSRRLQGEQRHNKHRRRLATVTGFDIDLAGNLERLPSSSRGAGDDASSKNSAALGVVIGAGVAIAALGGAVVVFALSRRGQKTDVDTAETSDPAELPPGMAMI